MPIRYQKRIIRNDLRLNPSWTYLFGDNEVRQGYGGQAKEMRGEHNAIGVRTKFIPAMTPQSFWVETPNEDGHRWRMMIAEDLFPAVAKLKAGGVVVIPADGIGTGLSKLSATAPRTFLYLQACLRRLAEL